MFLLNAALTFSACSNKTSDFDADLDQMEKTCDGMHISLNSPPTATFADCYSCITNLKAAYADMTPSQKKRFDDYSDKIRAAARGEKVKWRLDTNDPMVQAAERGPAKQAKEK